ncbi:MAG: hypothetical protein ACI9W6_000972 [Motiliproteus sp.]|jgi:hypothetical protein
MLAVRIFRILRLVLWKSKIFTGDVADTNYDSWNAQLSAALERSYQGSEKTSMTP